MSGRPARATILAAILVLVAALAPALRAAAQSGPAAPPAEPAPASPIDGAPPLAVEAPRVLVAGLAHEVSVDAGPDLAAASVPIEIRDAAGSVLARGAAERGARTTLELRVPSGRHELTVAAPAHYQRPVGLSVRAIRGWMTILPPAFAILLALIFRQVIPALVAGVWLGAGLVYDSAFGGALRTVDRYIVDALSDGDHISIVVFSMFLGGMVGVMSRAGGTAGLVDALRPYATTTRRGQLVTWFLGLLVFFDDYANTLVVGNTMRPVTDRLRISREKLAYIVDSTAAPVAAIFLVSTWIGYEVSLIGDALKAIGSEQDAYSVFLQAIPYNFYPILALVFGFMIAWTGRDFGPMRAAELRAAGGKVLADTAVPLSDFDSHALQPRDDQPRRWINALGPVAVVLVVTFGALWLTGRASLADAGDPLAETGVFGLGLGGLGSVLGAGDSYRALLWASSAGCLVAILLAVVQRILSLGQALDAMLGGFKSMVMAFVILTLAWSIAQVCTDLNTSGFMVSTLSDALDPRVLSTLVFLLAAVTAFATGSSWGTMGILIPLAGPTAYGVAQSAGYSAEASHVILLGAVSSVLAGAIFGDHCSPISDTTVLSSMSSGCDHVDHVRTQLPYALVVALVGTVLGELLTGFGVSPWIALAAGSVVLFAILRLAGRTSGP